jgi:hypothetical protein
LGAVNVAVLSAGEPGLFSSLTSVPLVSPY